MAEYTHGGDIRTAQAQAGREVLDFSANLNPLGMPEGVRRAAEAAVAGAVHYPDPFCRELTAAIAAHDGVEESQILCGNGAADLIFRLAVSERPRLGLVTAPTFSEYAQALRAVGCPTAHHVLLRERDFDLGADYLEALTPEVDVAFLCTPNNPTGRCADPALLRAILDKSRALGLRLVVDECFLELSTGGAGLAPLLGAYPNLVLLRAFTKSYAIPGLRLGYCLTADAALLDRLGRSAQPWSVSAPAQAAGVAALKEPDFPVRAREIIAREREFLQNALATLGAEVTPSQSNYILFRFPGRTDLREELLRRGVLIRSCANYQGLGPDDFRIAVRLREENLLLLAALKEVL